MNKREFDSLKTLPHFLLFYGDNFYLQVYQDKIEEKFKNENVLKLYFDEFDFNIAKAHLLESSLFGGQNILIIKTDKLKDIEKLKNYTKSSYCFIFYTGNKKINLKKQEFVRFFTPSFKEIMEHINELATKENVTISQEAKNFLAKSIEAQFLKEEIKKLAVYKNEISVNDVKELVFLYKEESFEELFIKILNNEEFFENIKSMIETVDYKRIIPAFINYITNLYLIHLYIKKTGNSKLKPLLGYQLPFDIETNRVKLAMKFKEADFKKMLDYLLNKELLMRSSDKEKEAIFWEVMIWFKNFHSF